MPILSLDQAKAQLNIAGTGYDAELTDYLAAVDACVEQHAGAVLDRTVTEVVQLHGMGLLVATRPVSSLTSMTAVIDGTVYDVSTLYVADALAGIIRRTDGLPMAAGGIAPAWSLTYTAGRGTTAPANINLAARIILQHLWETQRGSARGPGSAGPGETILIGAGFAIPHRAVELLGERVVGVA